MSMHRQLVLASSSPYRKALLEKLGLKFVTQTPGIDESPAAGEDAEALVQRLAKQKALAVAAHRPKDLIIASDQVAVLDQQILGKPGDASNAFRQLSACSGRQVTFYTSLCVYDAHSNVSECLVEPFTVGFRELSDAEIETYIKKEQPFDCAGSFKSEGLGISLFSYMRGDDPNSLIGLPLIQLLRVLRESYAINPLASASPGEPARQS